jgi:hypothetical protein
VAVGFNGTIITSTDGYNWTNQYSGVSTSLKGVAYADGEYAAVGEGGIILISSNAATWTRLPDVTSHTLYGIAGDAAWRAESLPQFFAVGDAGTAIQCSNGTNWSALASGTSNTLFSAAYQDGGYVMVGGEGTVILYFNSSFWPTPQSSVGTTNNLYGVAADPYSKVVAVGDLNSPFPYFTSNAILYSLDYGFDWQSQQWDQSFYNPDLWYPSGDFILRGVAHGANGFVAAGDTGYTLEYMYPGVVFTSAGGTNWVEQPASTSENRLDACAYGNGLYVLVGDAGGIVVSSNLVDWTEVTAHHRSAITAITCSTNLCIASGLPLFREYSSFPDFTTLVSSNGANWSVASTTLPAMADLASGGGRFVGVSGTSLYTTTDGYNWQTEGPFSNTLYGVCYANGRFVVVGDNGSILTSVDGTSWSSHGLATTGSLYSVTYGNGEYLAGGTVAAVSTDGMAWTLCASNPPAVIVRLGYGRGLFVAAATVGSYYNGFYNVSGGNILTSQDGAAWQVQFTPPSGGLVSGIAYSGGTFVAGVAGYGASAIYKSADGTNWLNAGYSFPSVDNGSFVIYYSSGLYNFFPALGDGYYQYLTICPMNGTFLAGSLDGVLMQSGNTWSPAPINSPQATSDQFSFAYDQQMDVPYRIQSSTNLVEWTDLYRGVGTGQSTNFTVIISTNNPARFFRIKAP